MDPREKNSKEIFYDNASLISAKLIDNKIIYLSQWVPFHSLKRPQRKVKRDLGFVFVFYVDGLVVFGMG
jgi:hypothetical protein